MTQLIIVMRDKYIDGDSVSVDACTVSLPFIRVHLIPSDGFLIYLCETLWSEVQICFKVYNEGMCNLDQSIIMHKNSRNVYKIENGKLKYVKEATTRPKSKKKNSRCPPVGLQQAGLNWPLNKQMRNSSVKWTSNLTTKHINEPKLKIIHMKLILFNFHESTWQMTNKTIWLHLFLNCFLKAFCDCCDIWL